MMKLLNSLYTVVSDALEAGRHDFTIRLNPEHFIYKAHFPGEPITPGVCIMQITQELLELSVGQPVAIQCVKNIKFLKVISPDTTTSLRYSFVKMVREDTTVKAQVEVQAGQEVYAKLSLICQITV